MSDRGESVSCWSCKKLSLESIELDVQWNGHPNGVRFMRSLHVYACSTACLREILSSLVLDVRVAETEIQKQDRATFYADTDAPSKETIVGAYLAPRVARECAACGAYTTTKFCSSKCARGESK